LDYESIFKQSVIDGFADGYLRGETPIPCIQCNQKVKFKDLLKASKDLNAEALITGHYVQRVKGPNGAELHRSNDKSKDQSYFLFATRQDELDYLRFPLGHMDKAETRRHGQRFDLNVADKPDSQDICFVPNGSYAQVVQKLRPGAIEPGPIVHVDGTILGQHKGIIHYTIGQRRGLALGDHNSGDPLYVIRLDPKKHRVIVGPKEALAQKEFAVHDINWLSEKMNDPISCQVKVRSTHNPIEASVHVDFQTLSGKVTLTENTYGIAPGQACVFYDGDRVLGGGWITREEICD
ncbi:MAG: tRNA 2-thiouridine(34) synthase MnmA, partial [Alphaproteobacteria bacterium]|nr:tRNA 2-thiouridine(34) synthase MnmA [Alphaproteobacteria bacterium]